MKCVEGSKEKLHWGLGSVGVNVNFRALEKSIWVLKRVRTQNGLFAQYVPRMSHLKPFSDRYIKHGKSHTQGRVVQSPIKLTQG